MVWLSRRAHSASPPRLPSFELAHRADIEVGGHDGTKPTQCQSQRQSLQHRNLLVRNWRRPPQCGASAPGSDDFHIREWRVEVLLQPSCRCPRRRIRSKFGFASMRTPSWLVVRARGGVHTPACQTWCGAVGPRAYRSAPSNASIAARAGVDLSSMVLNLLAVGRGETPLPG